MAESDNRVYKTLQHDKAAGKAVTDDRGRSVFEWDRDDLDSTTTLLKRLDNTKLKLEDASGVAAGHDPYNWVGDVVKRELIHEDEKLPEDAPRDPWSDTGNR